MKDTMKIGTVLSMAVGFVVVVDMSLIQNTTEIDTVTVFNPVTLEASKLDAETYCYKVGSGEYKIEAKYSPTVVIEWWMMCRNMQSPFV